MEDNSIITEDVEKENEEETTAAVTETPGVEDKQDGSLYPVPLALLSENPPDTPSEKPRRERRALSRMLSALLSFIFCGTSFAFMVSYGISVADRLGAERVGEHLLREVYGETAPPDTDDTAPRETVGAAPQDDAPEVVDTAAAEEAPSDGEDIEAPPSYPVSRITLSNTELLSALSNETAYEPDLAAALAEECGVGRCAAIYEEYGEEAPVVLIVHTHGTEAYIPEGETTYTTDESFRSHDTDGNVVAVGDVMAKVLESEGINVIHCTEMFDAESYRESYSRCSAAVSEYLREYPSISYVFDVHRDSIIADDMTCVATYADVEGEAIAQAMIVVGTDEGGADHETWEKNLSLALNVQKNMIDECGTLPRRINLRSAAFNQGLCSGALLFEIGSCGNTLREAKCAGALAALAAAEAINGAPCSVGAAEALDIFVPER
ncbi:MAG: stage II sporulation protein P [Clostridia bacterium]|nr:stage II sporulation protein P [Clostridia bacterium]